MSLFVVVRLRILNKGVKRIFLQPICLNPALLQIGPLKGQSKAWSFGPGCFTYQTAFIGFGWERHLAAIGLVFGQHLSRQDAAPTLFSQ
jgi:hypothetical protein